MRSFPIRQYWEKFLEFCSKAFLVVTVCIVFLWMISGAKGADPNKIVEITSNIVDGKKTIDIQFEREINSKDIDGKFERNFLQLTLTNTAAFPAKSLEIDDDIFEKVHAYQYEPSAVRARVFLTGDLRQIKNSIDWKTNGNLLRVTYDSTKVIKKKSVPESTLTKNIPNDVLVSTSSSNDRTTPLTTDEESLLKSLADRSAAATAPAPTAKVKAAAEAVVPSEDLYSGMKQEPKSASKKTNSSTIDFGKIILNLAFVLAMIGGLAWGFKKLVLKKGLGVGQSSGSIQVINTLTISPGKQIMVVKVADEFLVLGSSGGGINLITTLDRASGIDKYFGAASAKNTTNFADLLDEEEVSVESVAANEKPAEPSFSIRESIKSRVRGFKQLT
jgi:flagellar biosynthetic protein FliO